jgi:hypothetical protein
MHMGDHNKIQKKENKMQTEKTIKENLYRITSGPDNFGWAPLAWAHTED